MITPAWSPGEDGDAYQDADIDFMTKDEVATLKPGDLVRWRWDNGWIWQNGKIYRVIEVDDVDHFLVTTDSESDPEIWTDHRGFERVYPAPEPSSLITDILSTL